MDKEDKARDIQIFVNTKDGERKEPIDKMTALLVAKYLIDQEFSSWGMTVNWSSVAKDASRFSIEVAFNKGI